VGGNYFLLTVVLFVAYILTSRRSTREKVMFLGALVLFAVVLRFSYQMSFP
jgi:Ca2+/Na+ antiporter